MLDLALIKPRLMDADFKRRLKSLSWTKWVKKLEEEKPEPEQEDEPEGELWQLEIRTDSRGRKKRMCWNPNCKKWFVVEYKGQHYCRDTCRHQHQQRAEAL